MELLLILILACVLRIIFIISPSTDDYVHLWNVKLRKKLSNPWSHEVFDSVVQGKRGYPSLNHYIISLFPDKYWPLSGRIVGISYDCILIAIVYYFSFALFREYGIYSWGNFSPAASVAILLATSPILMPVTARIRGIGARSFGSLLSFLYFLSLGYGLLGNYWIGGIVCVLLGTMIILSSQFAFQNMVFISAIASIAYQNFLPFLVIIFILLLGWFIPKLGIRDILSFKFEHMKWYRRNYSKGTTASGRNRILDIVKLPVYLFKDISRFIKVAFYKSSFIIALYSLPPLACALFFFYAFPQTRDVFAHPVIFYTSIIIAGSIIVFFLTSLKPFLFLGQAERYFEYSLPFIAFFFIFLVAKYNLSRVWIYYVVIAQVIFVIINLIITKLIQSNTKIKDANDDNFNQLVETLNGLRGLRILTLPTKLAFKFSYAGNDTHAFYYRAINAKDRGFSYKDEDYAWFELPRTDIEHFSRKYCIDTLIVDKEILDFAKKKDIHYDISRFEKIFENERYILVKIKSA